MLEPKAPTARNGPNTGSLAPRVKRRVKKKLQILDKVVFFEKSNYYFHALEKQVCSVFLELRGSRLQKKTRPVKNGSQEMIAKYCFDIHPQ